MIVKLVFKAILKKEVYHSLQEKIVIEIQETKPSVFIYSFNLIYL